MAVVQVRRRTILHSPRAKRRSTLNLGYARKVSTLAGKRHLEADEVA
jgi:hypothetical protein